MRRLNNPGYDIIRFDRDSDTDDVGRAERWLRDGLVELRRRGWRKIIVGGQSRGGWNALQMLNYPGTADAIVAVSAAGHGANAAGVDVAHRQHDDLRRVLSGLTRQPTRVVIIQFKDDPYIGNADRRLELFTDRLQPNVAATLIIDRPDPFKGHGAATTHIFAERYGPCITNFLLGTDQSAGC